jgi:hypothetical protein
LQIDDSPPLQFSQVFQLIKEGGTYWVFNDVFRLSVLLSCPFPTRHASTDASLLSIR